MIKMAFLLPIQRINGKIVKTSEIVLVQFNLPGQIIKKKFKISRAEITTSFNAKFHIVNSLSTNVILRNDVLVSQGIFINLSVQNLRIEACKNIQIFLNIHIKTNSSTNRFIKNKSDVLILFKNIIKLFITYNDFLSNNKEFLFEPNKFKLKQRNGIYSHMMNHNFSFIQLKNDFKSQVWLKKQVVMGKLIEFNEDDFYAAESKNADLTLLMKNTKFIQIQKIKKKDKIKDFKNDLKFEIITESSLKNA